MVSRVWLAKCLAAIIDPKNNYCVVVVTASTLLLTGVGWVGSNVYKFW